MLTHIKSFDANVRRRNAEVRTSKSQRIRFFNKADVERDREIGILTGSLLERR